MSEAFPGSRLQPRYLIRGYQQAVERFSAGVRDEDPEPSALALFESLNWAIALDDYVRDVWKPGDEPLGHGWRSFAGGDDLVELLGATRYARNLVHHHWADALVHQEGRRYPRTYPLVYHSWLWRPAGELPPHPGEDRKEHVIRNREAYKKRLEGSLAESTLVELQRVFDDVWRFLDPSVRSRGSASR